MSDRSKRGPITYSGCWTCKERKVKCDEIPSGCRACARIGVTCGGYDIKLRWIHSQAGESSGESQVERTGRRRIGLGAKNTLRFDVEEVEKFLVEIENDSSTRFSSVRGPFTVFTATRYDSDQASTFGLLSPESDFQEPKGLESDYRKPEQHIDSIVVQSPHRQQHDFLDFLSSTSQDNSHDVCSDLIREPTKELTEVSELIQGERYRNRYFTSSSYTSPRSVTFLANQPVQHMSEFSETNALFCHYSVNVTDILQPLFHPDNPYRSIYVPTAVEGMFGSASTVRAEVPNVKKCIFHSLIATAAFHLSGHNLAPKYHKIGIRHRQMALQCMQMALMEDRPEVTYRNFMVALFSLVTIGVMEGTIIDFRIHIQAMMSLQRSRANWAILGPETVRLNQMSLFLSLLANTTSYDPLPEYRPQLREIRDCSTGGQVYFYEFTYGVTMDIVHAIEETMELHQIITNHPQQALLADFAESCEMLGDKLLSWSLSPGRAATIFPGQFAMQQIFEHHARAWCLGAIILYLQRIQMTGREDVAEQATEVANHLHKVEDLKNKNPQTQMAPITWPAFIASCSALDRDPWIAWWVRIQWYKIGSIRRQFEIVQVVWKGIDENPGVSWLDIIRRQKIEVLAL